MCWLQLDVDYTYSCMAIGIYSGQILDKSKDKKKQKQVRFSLNWTSEFREFLWRKDDNQVIIKKKIKQEIHSTEKKFLMIYFTWEVYLQKLLSKKDNS
jgi:hypothetical protein